MWSQQWMNANFSYLVSGQKKGQLISEQIWGVLNFPKMQQSIVRISAPASKMGQIKKVKAHPN